MVIAIGVVMLLGLGGQVFALSTRLVDVEIEVFHSWGLFGLGTWQPLPVDFVSMQITAFPEKELNQLVSLMAQCEGDSGADVQAACGTLSSLEYVFHRMYSLDPLVGVEYRVRIGNRTQTVLGIVLGIDGLNSNGSDDIVGDRTDKKWVILPQQTVTIAGWQVSQDEALAFRFAAPSKAHSPLDGARGEIRLDVYAADPGSLSSAKGTEAASLVDQPTVRIPFDSATVAPVESISLNYARDHATLGILCTETSGTGIRISGVVSGTMAELKGLREGDIITYVNAVPVNTCGELQSFLATRGAGDRVVVKVHREARVFLLTLELEE